ncbi:MAG TPA: tol-pal system protein YbgF [Woeseiaceae bacterium]|nr:tol-pal system protein YbgF [Woeseiaceae bacterium]
MFKAKKFPLALLPAVVLAGCAMTTPEDDPVVLKLNDLERRLVSVERILASGSLVDLAMQVDNLERQAAELQGRTETLEYQGEESGDRQRDLYQDLDQRIQGLEQRLQGLGGTSVGGTLAPGQLPVPGGSDRDNYQAAFELLKEQRYEPAANAFKQFLTSYPDSQLSDNAQYWLAESYYVTDQFDDALREFSVVVNDYPRSRKVPDALLKAGYANYELQRWDAARAALSRVQQEHADTTAARLAEQRLNRMTEEGH